MNYIKLQSLIVEDQIITAKQRKVDKQIKNEIDKLGKLQSQIDRLKKQIEPLQKKYGEVMKDVLPVINKLDKETITTNQYVLRILRKGFQRETFQYKEGFLNGLEKVNKNTQRILRQILEETKKLTTIKPSVSIHPIKETLSGKLKQWYNRFKSKLKGMIKSLKGISDGNKQLKKLI